MPIQIGRWRWQTARYECDSRLLDEGTYVLACTALWERVRLTLHSESVVGRAYPFRLRFLSGSG